MNDAPTKNAPRYALRQRLAYNLSGDEVTTTGVRWTTAEPGGGDWLYTVEDDQGVEATMTERHLARWNPEAVGPETVAVRPNPRFEIGDVVRYASGSARVGHVTDRVWNDAIPTWVYRISDTEHNFADWLSEKFLMSLRDDGDEAAVATEPKTTPRSVDDMMREADQAAQYAAAMRAQAVAMQKAIEDARRPKQPEVVDDVPTVVVFAKYMSGRSYAYAAVGWRYGSHVRWAITSSQSGSRGRYTWKGLLEFIGEANWHTLALVTDVVRIGPSPDDEPAVVEVMANYGRVVGTNYHIQADEAAKQDVFRRAYSGGAQAVAEEFRRQQYGGGDY